MLQELRIYLVEKDGMLSVLNALSACSLNTRKKTLRNNKFEVPLTAQEAEQLRLKGCVVQEIINAKPLIQKITCAA